MEILVVVNMSVYCLYIIYVVSRCVAMLLLHKQCQTNVIILIVLIDNIF